MPPAAVKKSACPNCKRFAPHCKCRPSERAMAASAAAVAARSDDTSLGWARAVFELFGKSKELDKSVGQDCLYVAVKMSAADRAVWLRVLRELLGKK